MDGEIDPATVKELVDGDAEVTVVDVRSPDAFSRGHVPGSVCVPLPELVSEVDRVADEPADRIVTVCPHGQASVRAARLVAAYEGVGDDVRVESMAGGLSEWEWDLDRGDAGSEASDPPF